MYWKGKVWNSINNWWFCTWIDTIHANHIIGLVYYSKLKSSSVIQVKFNIGVISKWKQDSGFVNSYFIKLPSSFYSYFVTVVPNWNESWTFIGRIQYIDKIQDSSQQWRRWVIVFIEGPHRSCEFYIFYCGGILFL